MSDEVTSVARRDRLQIRSNPNRNVGDTDLGRHADVQTRDRLLCVAMYFIDHLCVYHRNFWRPIPVYRATVPGYELMRTGQQSSPTVKRTCSYTVHENRLVFSETVAKPP